MNTQEPFYMPGYPPSVDSDKLTGRYYVMHDIGKHGKMETVTRAIHDLSSAESFAHMDVDELKAKKNKADHAYTRVYIMQVVEVFDVNPELRWKPDTKS